MASDHIINITVEPPAPAPAPLENTADSPTEDEDEISQPSNTAQERNPQILELLPKARDHLKRSQARVSEKPYIYRVPHRLREVNKRAYEPNVISFGPYHHGKMTEAIKLSCFLNILKGNNSVTDKIVRTMQSLEAQVRECYEEPSGLDSTEFVEMMVYDGCFIVQLIRGYSVGNIVEDTGVIDEIDNDLLLLENQIPFFVLSELYHIIVPADVNQFAHRALSYFRDFSLFHLFDDLVSDKDIKHLLHLVHSCQHPSASGIKQQQDFKKRTTTNGRSRNSRMEKLFSQMAARLRDCMHLSSAASEPTSQYKMKFIGNASELDDAGIDFLGATLEKMKDPKQGIETEFDIMFTKGTKVLVIPTLNVDDSTERRFRNYIAYEQFIPGGKPTYFSDYVSFMDYLVNTSKDVQLLRKCGIIENWLGGDEAVAQMFNRLLESVWWSEHNFYYAEIFKRVDEHCQRRWNRWKAALRKNYFNSPWSHISFFAATFLLLLTTIQTIFSVLSYFEQQD